MATKYLDGAGLKLVIADYKAKDDAKVDKKEGHGLYPDADKTKLAGIDEGAQKNNITSVTVNGKAQTIIEGVLAIDVETIIQGDGFVKTEDLTDYLKGSEADGKYATKEELTNLGTILGECLFEELETNKEGATKGDCYVVTDKNNHLYYYNGEDFIDTQNVIDLTPYLQKTEAESTYAKKSELEGKADTAALDDYIKKEEKDTELADYTTDSELTTKLADYLLSATADTTYVKSAEFDGKVKSVVGTVYHVKGSLENLEAIKAVVSPAEGDVYNATDTGANYVYVGGEDGVDGTGWDKLSETIDLSSYALKSELTGKANTSDLPTALSTEEVEAIITPPEMG